MNKLKLEIRTGLYSDQAKAIFDFIRDVLVQGFYPNSPGRVVDTRNSIFIDRNSDGEIIAKIDTTDWFNHHRSAFYGASVKNEKSVRNKLACFVHRPLERGIRVRNFTSNGFSDQTIWIDGIGQPDDKLVLDEKYSNCKQYMQFKNITWGQLRVIKALLLGQRRALKNEVFKKILDPLIGRQRDPMLAEMIQSTFLQMNDIISHARSAKEQLLKDYEARISNLHREKQQGVRDIDVNAKNAIVNSIKSLQEFGVTDIPTEYTSFVKHIYY